MLFRSNRIFVRTKSYLGLALVIIILSAFIGSLLTFFSGFGLGTILLAVFSLFFPIEIAIPMTAIVHFLNNIFKLFLTYEHIDKDTVKRFGIPSVVGSVCGALLLLLFVKEQADMGVVLLKKIIGALIILFACLELFSSQKKIGFNVKFLPIGGFLSGLFGGFSGHQGAIRSVFLLKLNLTKESLVATGVVIACLIDSSRLLLYNRIFFINDIGQLTIPIVSAVIASFIGAYLGNRFLKKTKIEMLQYFIFVMLIVFGLYLLF